MDNLLLDCNISGEALAPPAKPAGMDVRGLLRGISEWPQVSGLVSY